MKIKTSITLSEDLLQAIDQLPDQYHSRSYFLEVAAWTYIDQLRRAEQARRDVEIINRRVDYLNAEVLDALEYQAPL
jgi:metal-responsive CopG/Arc/MetJ family transcriptional regulator